ncbi:hypothetical protein BKA66DRAFT_515682 [Pyrenochaeta sp. MPI-SDFR-AT-0127]|nr:hypothetical protein BKA66DRAFT_515682 [Pyrenochaeta sp. MPI-SDFR-AT-0127]
MLSLFSCAQRKRNHMIRTSLVPPAWRRCITPLETHYRGNFLPLRVITPPDRMTGILVLVEDEIADVVDPMGPDIWQSRILDTARSAGALKLKGNATMKDDALLQEAISDEIAIIKRNKALAFLETRQLDAALYDRKAPYFLRRFDECIKVLEQLNASFTNNEQEQAALSRARCRSTDQTTGKYHFRVLQAESKKLWPPQLDHATYIEPVEIRITENKGSKIKRLDFIIVQKIYRNPFLDREFTTLYLRAYEAAALILFLVEHIMSFDAFGCPVSSLAIHKDLLAKKTKSSNIYHSCDIWAHTSYINNSCYGNARRWLIGDMIVRATRDLALNEEIIFWYQSPDGISIVNLQQKLKHWEFVCEYIICQDAKGTSSTVMTEGNTLLKKMKRLCTSCSKDRRLVDELECLLTALNERYTQFAPEFVEKVLGTLGFVVFGADYSTTCFRIVTRGLVIDYAVGSCEDSKQTQEYTMIAYSIIVGEAISFEETYRSDWSL